MTPERWQKINDLFQAALDCKPQERPSFLDRACGGDKEAREEVEVLLSADDQATDFIERPALEIVASLFSAHSSQTLIGKSISHYRIESKLGAGGMGDVYLAQDTILGRRVALKVLPSNLCMEEERLIRFKQEACTTSVLNHPNIVTVYEIGQVDSIHYIAAEFITGETLRQQMLRTDINLEDAIDIVVQVAGALAAAHKAGVVHRDVKPENIMVRPDGQIKVLDFGIAKIMEQSSLFNEDVLELTRTNPGELIGSPYYMSPEQVRGVPIDERTDIFSLGVVFYELITGTRPFEGATRADVIALLLNEAPSPLAHCGSNAPAEVQGIIDKLLCKDRNERYQSAEELLADLTKQKTHSVSTIKDYIVNRGARPKIYNPLPLTSEIADSFPEKASGIKALLNQIKIATGAAVVSIATLIILIPYVQAVYLPHWYKQAEPERPGISLRMVPSKITQLGKVTKAAISPDGMYIAYVVSDHKSQSIWLRHSDSSRNVQLLTPSNVSYEQVAFSANSEYIYYIEGNSSAHGSQIFVISVLGGPPRKIVGGVGKSFSVSPDGKQVAFTRLSEDQRTVYLMRAETDGVNEQVIAQRDRGWLEYPAWSPEGNRIAFISGSGLGADPIISIIEVSLDQDKGKTLSFLDFRTVESLVWCLDGSKMFFLADGQIWGLSYGNGELQKITNDLSTYKAISSTADSSTLCTVQLNWTEGIWIAPREELNRAKQITFGADDGTRGICWNSNNRIVYSSGEDIWVMDSDGSNQKQLTLNSGRNINPSASPDGNYIVFSSDRLGAFNIWVMDINGNNAVQLTKGGEDNWPQYSSGNKIVFRASESIKSSSDEKMIIHTSTLWQISLDGGFPSSLLKDANIQPAISPDGSRLAFFGAQGIYMMPVGGGQPKKIVDTPLLLPRSPEWISTSPLLLLWWTADGSALTYVADEKGLGVQPIREPAIWIQPINGGPARLIGKHDGGIRLSWSPDSKNLAFPRRTSTSDVILINSVK